MTISPECGQHRVVVVRPAEVILVVRRWRHLHAAPIFIHRLQASDPPHLFFYPPTLRPGVRMDRWQLFLPESDGEGNC